MLVITTDHRAHDPDSFTTPADGRRYWEIPARVDALMETVQAKQLATRPAKDHGMAPIERVHDKDYLGFLQSAFARYQAGPVANPILRAQAYAVRHRAH